MPQYKLSLEVEVNCPVDLSKPELTITPLELMENIITDKSNGSGGYAVCVKGNPQKLTGSMRIVTAKLHPHVCPHCGSWSAGTSGDN